MKQFLTAMTAFALLFAGGCAMNTGKRLLNDQRQGFINPNLIECDESQSSTCKTAKIVIEPRRDAVTDVKISLSPAKNDLDVSFATETGYHYNQHFKILLDSRGKRWAIADLTQLCAYKADMLEGGPFFCNPVEKQ